MKVLHCNACSTPSFRNGSKTGIASVLGEEDACVADEQVELGVIREFTHVATPEENSYIEDFHSIVEIEVVDRFEFESFHHAKMFFLAL